MHEKLKSQIEHHLGHAFSPPETWNNFLTAVDETYRSADHHNLLLEHSQNSISSELETQSRQIDLVLNFEGDGILIFNLNGEITSVNLLAARMLGYPDKALVGKLLHPVIHHTRADGTPCQEKNCVMMKSLGQNASFRRIDDVFWTREGTRLPVEYTCTPLLEQGVVREAIVVFKSVAERKNIERALTLYAQEQEENHKNMKDFVSIISHDLKEPLRKVMVFGSFLLENHSDQLDVKGKDYLNRMIKSTDRMNLFIDDLLLYSEVGGHDLKLQPVDLQVLIRRIIAGLAHPEPAPHFNHHIEISDATAQPTVEADPSQIKLLFRNLLLNAIKFQKKDVLPMIRIEIKDKDLNFITIQVQDNGIGFRPDHSQRIFKPFERLHGKDDYPGTGMGLPVCSRIASRHGGKITATGAPQQGATFTVTLPKKQIHKKN